MKYKVDTKFSSDWKRKQLNILAGIELPDKIGWHQKREDGGITINRPGIGLTGQREVLIQRDNFKTVIINNGSTWLGEQPYSLEVLYELLEKLALDSMFEGFTNFRPETGQYDWAKRRYWGNFAVLSHGFDIATNDLEIIDSLETLITENQKSRAYQSKAITETP